MLCEEQRCERCNYKYVNCDCKEGFLSTPLKINLGQTMHEIIKNFEKLGCTVTEAGSRVTCNPPPMDTDQDFLVNAAYDPMFENEKLPEVISLLLEENYECESNQEHYQNQCDDGFMSWRKGDLNFIVTASQTFADRHRAATALCKKLNLMNKEDRIDLFQAVLYGNQPKF